MTRVKLKAIAPYAIIFLIALVFYVIAGETDYVARPGSLGPDFWPKVLLALTMLACLYEIFRHSFPSRERADAERTQANDAGGAPQGHTVLLVAGMVLTVAYALLIEVLGFLISTFLYLFHFMVIGRYRRLGVAAASSLVGTLALAFIFIKVIYISLPHGHDPFSTISFFVMQLMGIR
jgi:putative tricarboxylic transport membrane protein